MKVVHILTSLAVLGVTRGQQYLSGGMMTTPLNFGTSVGSSIGGSMLGQGWMNDIMSQVVTGFGGPQAFTGGGFSQSLSGGFGEVVPIGSAGFGGITGLSGISGMGVGGINRGLTIGSGVDGGQYPPGSFIGPAPDFLSGGNTNFDTSSRGDLSGSWGSGFSGGGSGSWGQTIDPGFSMGSSNSWASSGGINSGFSLGSSNALTPGSFSSSGPIY